MRPKTTLALALLVALVVAVIWFWEKDVPGTAERIELQSRVFADLEAEEITSLSLSGPDSALTLRKRGEEWWIETPFEDRADELTVESLMTSIAELDVRSRVKAASVVGGDDATGLGGKALVIRITDASSSERALEIGGPGPTRSVYARLIEADSPDELVLIEDHFVARLAQPSTELADELRDPLLMTMRSPDVLGVRLERDGQPLLIAEREPDGPWRAEQPFVDEIASSGISTLLSQAAALRAQQFLQSNTEPIDRWTLTVSSASSSQTLTLGEQTAAGGAHRSARISNRDVQAEVFAPELLETMSQIDESWRSLEALRFSTWNVTDVELSRGDTTVSAKRNDSGWTLTQPSEFALDQAALDSLIFEWARIEAVELADDVTPASVGLDPPIARLAVVQENEKRSELLIGHARDESTTYAQRVGRAVVLVIPTETAKRIDPTSIRSTP